MAVAKFDPYKAPLLLSATPRAEGSLLAYKQWLVVTKNWISKAPAGSTEDDLLASLSSAIAPSNFAIIQNCDTLDLAYAALDGAFLTKTHNIVARGKLYNRKQLPQEDLATFLASLRILLDDCEFKPVTASKRKNEALRDAFVNGIRDPSFKQKVLQEGEKDLEETLAYMLLHLLTPHVMLP